MDELILTEGATAALRLAATRRPRNGSLTTGLAFAAISQVDMVQAWDRIWLHAGEPDAIQLADAPETDGQRAAHTWENVPLSGDMANAMAGLRMLCEKYTLVPASTGVLALALVMDPRSGAARRLCADGLSHPALLEIIQDDLIGMSLGGLSAAIAGMANPKAKPGVGDPSARELLELAAGRAAGRRAPDEMDVLAVMLTVPKTAGLLGRLGLGKELIEEAEEPLRAIGLRSALEVDPNSGESAMHLLAGLAKAPSPGLSWLLRLTGIDKADVAAEAMEMAAADAGRRRRSSRSVVALGLVNLLLSLVTLALLALHVAGSGSLWELLLIPLIWVGYPRWPSVLPILITVPMYLLVSPTVGVIQLIAGFGDWLQARAERRELIARTGVIVSRGVLRRVAVRRMRKGRANLARRRKLRIRLLTPRLLRAATNAPGRTTPNGLSNAR
jgi:hypothetical protein